LFGQAYTFKASGEVGQPEEVADYVAGQIEKAHAAPGATNKIDALVLAAMNIAYDYFEMKRRRQDLASTVDQRCKNLIEYIDSNA
jgi:cell division protein ZapA (FtsZ GTPase activity inhibitor)